MRIENFKELPLSSAGQTVGTFDIAFTPEEMLAFPIPICGLNNFRLVKSKKGNLFVSRPSYKTTDDQTGEAVWKEIVSCPKEMSKTFQETLLSALGSEITGRYGSDEGRQPDFVL